MLKTTMGQLLVNQALPPEMRDYSRVLDKQGVRELFQELADKHPERYRDVAKEISDAGRSAATSSGGHSFGLRHLRTTAAARMSRQRLRRRMRDILSNEQWDDDTKEQKIIEAAAQEKDRLQKEVYDEALANDNPLALQVRSGARGKPGQLQRLIGGDMLYVDHRDQIIPFPVQKTYAEGLSDAEWFAGSFGGRKGLVDTKFATQDAGFFAKQLNQLAHRLIVVGEDAQAESGEHGGLRGLPVDVSDADNEGALLASPAGDYPRNTVLTPKILADLKNNGIKRLLVRSPAVGGPVSGVYARDAGVHETGRTPNRGDLIGLSAAQSLSERITQGQLESKHAGGVKGTARAVRGFDVINSQIQVPKKLKGGAAHAEVDGRVERVEEAPAGGQYVWIEGQKHFVSPGFDLRVKNGDTVEAGDTISEGIPNPANVVKHKGIGEGRRYFVQEFTRALRESGLPAHRRNVELIARGLIDHVEMLEEDEDYAPGDLMGYNRLEHTWQPRRGFRSVTPKQALGKYLERPVLHYTVGTRVRPSTLRDLEEFGVQQVDVHDDEPPFQPRMVRAMESIGHDPDWMVRMLGSGQKKSLLGAVHRGATSDTTGTSFVPALAEGTPFGQDWPSGVFPQPPKS